MLPAALLALAWLPSLYSQSSGILTATPPARNVGKRGEVMAAKVAVQMRGGYHVNSNTPADPYIIPLRLTWDAAPLEVAEVVYPKPQLENYSFSTKPVSVFTGDFDVVTRFKVPARMPLGPGVLIGKLRYQACTDSSCLPPKTVEIRLPIQIQ